MADDRHREAIDIIARWTIVDTIGGRPPKTYGHGREVAARIGEIIDQLTPSTDEHDAALVYLRHRESAEADT